MSTNFFKLIEEFDTMLVKNSSPNYNLKGRLSSGGKILGFSTNIPSTNIFEDNGDIGTKSLHLEYLKGIFLLKLMAKHYHLKVNIN